VNLRGGGDLGGAPERLRGRRVHVVSTSDLGTRQDLRAT
jgi:hypothetical protein